MKKFVGIYKEKYADMIFTIIVASGRFEAESKFEGYVKQKGFLIDKCGDLFIVEEIEGVNII